MTTAQVLYCEDTRTTKRLLDYLGVSAQSMRSLHAHNEKGKVRSDRQ
jgi:16S rRNA C1402 (ribose-2'-O) methylase RsmI